MTIRRAHHSRDRARTRGRQRRHRCGEPTRHPGLQRCCRRVECGYLQRGLPTEYPAEDQLEHPGGHAVPIKLFGSDADGSRNDRGSRGHQTDCHRSAPHPRATSQRTADLADLGADRCDRRRASRLRHLSLAPTATPARSLGAAIDALRHLTHRRDDCLQHHGIEAGGRPDGPPPISFGSEPRGIGLGVDPGEPLPSTTGLQASSGSSHALADVDGSCAGELCVSLLGRAAGQIPRLVVPREHQPSLGNQTRVMAGVEHARKDPLLSRKSSRSVGNHRIVLLGEFDRPSCAFGRPHRRISAVLAHVQSRICLGRARGAPPPVSASV